MLNEKAQTTNHAMDLINLIDDSITNYNYDKIIFRLTGGSILIISNDDYVGANTVNPNFLEVHKNKELHFINLNNLAEVVVEYGNQSS